MSEIEDIEQTLLQPCVRCHGIKPNPCSACDGTGLQKNVKYCSKCTWTMLMENTSKRVGICTFCRG